MNDPWEHDSSILNIKIFKWLICNMNQIQSKDNAQQFVTGKLIAKLHAQWKH